MSIPPAASVAFIFIALAPEPAEVTCTAATVPVLVDSIFIASAVVFADVNVINAVPDCNVTGELSAVIPTLTPPVLPRTVTPPPAVVVASSLIAFDVAFVEVNVINAVPDCNVTGELSAVRPRLTPPVLPRTVTPPPAVVVASSNTAADPAPSASKCIAAAAPVLVACNFIASAVVFAELMVVKPVPELVDIAPFNPPAPTPEVIVIAPPAPAVAPSPLVILTAPPSPVPLASPALRLNEPPFAIPVPPAPAVIDIAPPAAPAPPAPSTTVNPPLTVAAAPVPEVILIPPSL